jgi:hypothetical protein
MREVSRTSRRIDCACSCDSVTRYICMYSKARARRSRMPAGSTQRSMKVRGSIELKNSGGFARRSRNVGRGRGCNSVRLEDCGSA